MILGISGSPRPNQVTADAVKYCLSQFDEETQYISLSGKKISGCIACLRCAKTNVCALQDDFTEISEKIKEADAIILGVPNYFGLPNAITHSMLERMFAYRHRSQFLIEDKPVILFSTGYAKDVETSPVIKTVSSMLQSNRVNILDKFLVDGFSQCYTCGCGENCVDGNVVKNHGIVQEITPDMLPPRFSQQPHSMKSCDNAVKVLKKHLCCQS